jgi:flagellar protein FliO/FliZ
MRLFYLVLLCGLLWPATIMAQATTGEAQTTEVASSESPPEPEAASPLKAALKADTAPERPSTGLGLGKMALSLSLVVAIVIALGWAFKKLTLRLPGSRHIKIISTMPLGPKERLLVIEVQGKQRVLGVTAQSINLLFELENPLPEEKLASDFHTQLQSFLKK